MSTSSTGSSSWRDPGLLLGTANTVGLIGLGVYFTKRIQAVEANLMEMANHMKSAIDKLEKVHVSSQEVPKIIHAIRALNDANNSNKKAIRALTSNFDDVVSVSELRDALRDAKDGVHDTRIDIDKITAVLKDASIDVKGVMGTESTVFSLESSPSSSSSSRSRIKEGREGAGRGGREGRGGRRDDDYDGDTPPSSPVRGRTDDRKSKRGGEDSKRVKFEDVREEREDRGGEGRGKGRGGGERKSSKWNLPVDDDDDDNRGSKKGGSKAGGGGGGGSKGGGEGGGGGGGGRGDREDDEDSRGRSGGGGGGGSKGGRKRSEDDEREDDEDEILRDLSKIPLKDK